MVDILVDVYVAEAALQLVFETEKDSVANLYYDQIFTIHEVDRSQFYENVSILRDYPSLTKRVYGKVVEQLKAIEKKEK